MFWKLSTVSAAHLAEQGCEWRAKCGRFTELCIDCSTVTPVAILVQIN